MMRKQRLIALALFAAVIGAPSCDTGDNPAGATSKPGGNGGGTTPGEDVVDDGSDGADTAGPVLTGDPVWRLVELGESATWKDLTGYVRDDGTSVVALCGTNGVVGVYDGVTPVWRNLGIANSINGVWAHDDATMVVAGDGGIIRHYNAATGGWTDAAEYGLYPNLPDFLAVGGGSPDDVYAGGVSGTLWHYDGLEWTPVKDLARDGGSPTDTSVSSIWVDAEHRAWITSGTNIIWGKGFTWTRYSPDQAFKLEAAHGAVGGPIFAVGWSSKILRYEADEWTQDPAGIAAPLLPGVFAWAPDGAIATTRNKTQPLLLWRMTDGALAWDRVRDVDALAFTNTGKGKDPINATALELGKVWGTGPEDLTILVSPVGGASSADLLQFRRVPAE